MQELSPCQLAHYSKVTGCMNACVVYYCCSKATNTSMHEKVCKLTSRTNDQGGHKCPIDRGKTHLAVWQLKEVGSSQLAVRACSTAGVSARSRSACNIKQALLSTHSNLDGCQHHLHSSDTDLLHLQSLLKHRCAVMLLERELCVVYVVISCCLLSHWDPIPGVP